MPSITSTANPHVAALRALHTGKGRSEAGMFLVEGLHYHRRAGCPPGTGAAALRRRRAGPHARWPRPDGPAGGSARRRRAHLRRRPRRHRPGLRHSGAAGRGGRDPDRGRGRGHRAPAPPRAGARAGADPRCRERSWQCGHPATRGPGRRCGRGLGSPRLRRPAAPKVVRAASGATFIQPVRAPLPWQRGRGPARWARQHVHQVALAEATARDAYDELDLTQRTALIVCNQPMAPRARPPGWPPGGAHPHVEQG